MPDIFLRQGAANPNDVILRNPLYQELNITLTKTLQSATLSSAVAVLDSITLSKTLVDSILSSTITVVGIATSAITLTKTLADATLSCKIKHLGKLVGGVGSSFHLVPEPEEKLPVRWLWLYAKLNDATVQSVITTKITAKAKMQLNDASMKSFTEVEDDDLQLIEYIATILSMEEAA